jgi:hypothetical protein
MGGSRGRHPFGDKKSGIPTQPPEQNRAQLYDQRITPAGNLMYIILVHHTSSHNYQMHACGNWEGYIIQVARNLVWLDTQSVIVEKRVLSSADYLNFGANYN